MVASGFMALLVWICGSVLFYEFEQDNPRMEGAFKDLPSSMYYTIIFLGGEWAKIDFTPGGRIVCMIYCVAGIGLYGIPIGAVFEAFSDVLENQESEEVQAQSLSQGRTLDANQGTAGRGHDFRLTTFYAPEHCSVCGNLLLGLWDQGYKCASSGQVVCHSCLPNVPNDSYSHHQEGMSSDQHEENSSEWCGLERHASS
eukprot:TRINITY_DN26702_c0_g1_i1.p1 TRINITY_DN26702_c0_g1~~TRINITY_DN26702_c0_g1_i1.p1  ORF type:complete len:227 (+),score=36.78 TRINITY_DN26702_c0_g1_i1:85-681(+)